MSFLSFHSPLASALWYFFFQAEDGIRDGTVTGVQTCALPISGGRRLDASAEPPDVVLARWDHGGGRGPRRPAHPPPRHPHRDPARARAVRPRRRALPRPDGRAG